jgi:hypothetical protein
MRYWNETDNETAESPVSNSLLAAKNPWMQQQFSTSLVLGDRPFVVGRRPAAREELPPWQPDLELNDTAPFRLSRNHFTIKKREGAYRVRDLCSTPGTIVNGERIGASLGGDGSTTWEHLASDAQLRAGENQVIAGGPDSPFIFPCLSPLGRATTWLQGHAPSRPRRRARGGRRHRQNDSCAARR